MCASLLSRLDEPQRKDVIDVYVLILKQGKMVCFNLLTNCQLKKERKIKCVSAKVLVVLHRLRRERIMLSYVSLYPPCLFT